MPVNFAHSALMLLDVLAHPPGVGVFIIAHGDTFGTAGYGKFVFL